VSFWYEVQLDGKVILKHEHLKSKSDKP
jgi:DNA polymerase epsilon subunit 1